MKIIDYVVVESDDVDELRLFVLEHIGKGWQPLGGIVPETEYDNYMQTMVKYEDSNA